MSKTKLVGIVNLTPDSFTDGGLFHTTQEVLAYIDALAEQGADIVDIGAESTRPGATPLTHEEEWRRLSPIMQELSRIPIPVSIDTRHAKTARKALDAGAHWINDVSGFSNPDMIAAVKDSNCKLVVMHSLSVPADKNIIIPENADVIEELRSFIHTRVAYMEKAGIKRERILFDPGIGFSKTLQQSHYILENIAALRAFGFPLYIGHSRKSFLGLPPNATNDERDDATLVVSKRLIAQGVDYLRVHNVKRHRELLNG